MQGSVCMQALSDQNLRLSTALESREWGDGLRLMKQTRRAEYLALTPDQYRILERFREGGRVGDVLHALLVGGEGVHIRDFYDLVAAALEKGFLCHGGGEVEAERVGRRWTLGWGGAPAVLIGILMIVLGGVALFAWEPVLWRNWTDLTAAIGTLFFSMGLSGVLAGCVLSGFGRMVYNPGIYHRWGIPHFEVDDRDAFMGGRFCEACVALQRLGGAFFVFGLVWFFRWDAAAWGALLAVAIRTCPFGGSAAHALLHAIFRRDYQLPMCADRFLRTKVFTQFFDWKSKMLEEKYLLLFSTYALLWMAAGLRLVSRFLQLYGALLLRHMRQPGGLTGEIASGLGVATLAVAIAAPMGFLIWMVVRSGLRMLAPGCFSFEARLHRQAQEKKRPETGEIVAFLRETLLFSQLDDKTLEETARSMMFTIAPAGTPIVREGEKGKSLCLVYEGRVEVGKETETGENKVVAVLRPGDVFGEISLLDQVPRTGSVRAVEETGLLVLSKAGFEKLLVGHLGAEKIRTTVQISSFLRRNSLFADWPVRELMRAAGIFEFRSVKEGEKLIEQGRANDFFYLVYEGRLEVRKQGVEQAVLHPGDFCGEISLLRGIPATADVTALENGRCLRLGKEEFLKFVSRDFLTGYLVEDVMEARLRGES